MKFIKRCLRLILPLRALRLIYRRQADRYIGRLPGPEVSTRQTILVLNHFYDQDVRALQRSNQDYNLIPIDTPVLFRGARTYFDEEVRELQAPYAGADPTQLALYRDECRRIFRALDEKLQVGLIVTASDIFYWVREFITVAREAGVNTVVLDKEGTLSPYDFEAEARRIKNFAPFMSEHIYVWSERQRGFWNKIGVESSRISVIGQARSDLLFCEAGHEVEKLFPKSQPLITLFSYMDDAYVPVKLIQSEGLNWRSMKAEMHDEFFRLAQDNPGHNFVVKTHPQQADLAELQQKYRLPNLLVLGGSAIANELLQRSELIIAFQTTAVIEAMFLNRRVIYTYWDPLVARLQDDLLPFHRAKGINVVRSYDDFKAICERFFAGDAADFELSDEDIRQRDLFVNEYFYKPDGHVCDRFFEAVRALVK